MENIRGLNTSDANCSLLEILMIHAFNKKEFHMSPRNEASSKRRTYVIREGPNGLSMGTIIEIPFLCVM